MTSSSPTFATERERRVGCPFCDETDFDLVGLKLHLLRGWCEPFDALEALTDFERDARALAEARESNPELTVEEWRRPRHTGQEG